MTHRYDPADLAITVSELVDAPNNLLLHLHATIAHRPATGYTENGPTATKVIGSPAPWNDQAAGLYFDIHAGARRHESALTLLLHHRARYRYEGGDPGAAHRATTSALRALPDLIRAAQDRFPDHHVHTAAARDLTSWPRAVRIHLDEARPGEVPWTRAPGGLTCPYCERRLVLAPGWERDASAPIWCRGCPTRLEGEQGRVRVDRDWPAGAWVAVLNQQDAS